MVMEIHESTRLCWASRLRMWFFEWDGGTTSPRLQSTRWTGRKVGSRQIVDLPRNPLQLGPLCLRNR